MAGKVANVKLFLDRYPEFIAAKAPGSGDSVLHFACFIGKGQQQADMVQTLIDKGADPNVSSLFWGTPLLAAAAKYDTDPQVVKQLVDAGADVNALRKPAGALKAIRAIGAGLGTVFGSVGLQGLARIVAEVLTFKGRTVLHFASERGDVNMIRTLTEVAPLLQVDVKGGTGAKGARLPLQVAEQKFGPHVVMKETIAKVLESHGQKGLAAAAAPVAAPAPTEEEAPPTAPAATAPDAAPATADPDDVKKGAHHGARPAFGSQRLAPNVGAPAAETNLLDQLGQLSQRIFHGAPEAAPRVAEAKEAAEAKPDLTA